MTALQRIDQSYTPGNYWTFYRPSLEPFDASIVVKSGPNGYACYNKGNTYLFGPPNATAGYTDRELPLFVSIAARVAKVFIIAFYANVLVRDAWRLSPALLLSFETMRSNLVASTVNINNAGPHPALVNSALNLTVVFDPDTYLPTRVRAYENHKIFGPSTNDILLYNYTEIQGTHFARNVKLLYNEDLMLQEMLFDSITINATFPSNFFTGLPYNTINQTIFGLPPTPAAFSELYDTAEVFESS